MSVKISLTSEKSRYNSILKSLELLKDDIKDKIKDKKRITVKVNFTNSKNVLSATNVDALKALLDFFKGITDKIIYIAEAPFAGNIELALENFQYTDLLKKYNIKFIDLNKADTKKFEIDIKKSNKKVTLNLSKAILESDFLISLTPPKTHDYYIVTLGLKNLAVGSTIIHGAGEEHFRGMYHQGYKEGNVLLSEVCKKVMPTLNILDGWEAMEGNGPVCGIKYDWNIAVAGLDALAVDCFTADLMGFNPDNVGYLYYLKEERNNEIEFNNFEILGMKNFEVFKRKFKKPDGFEKQLEWKY